MFRLSMTLAAAALLAACAPAPAQDSTAASKGSTTAAQTTKAASRGRNTDADSAATIAAISPAHARARVVIADLTLLVIAVVLTWQLMRVLAALTNEVQAGGAPGVESHWGGFGGGMGGWRVSPALSYVFAALVLAALVGSIATILDRRVRVVPSSGTDARAPSTAGAAGADSIRRESIRRDSIRRDSIRTDSIRRASAPTDSAANQGATTQPGGAPAPPAGTSSPAF